MDFILHALNFILLIGLIFFICGILPLFIMGVIIQIIIRGDSAIKFFFIVGVFVGIPVLLALMYFLNIFKLINNTLIAVLNLIEYWPDFLLKNFSEEVLIAASFTVAFLIILVVGSFDFRRYSKVKNAVR